MRTLRRCRTLSDRNCFRFCSQILPEARCLLGGKRPASGSLDDVHERGGAEEDRTPDPLLAKQVLSQLSYSPIPWNPRRSFEAMVGLGRFELPTSPLSGVRSNQLSYRPGIARIPAQKFRAILRRIPAEPDCSSCTFREVSRTRLNMLSG